MKLIFSFLSIVFVLNSVTGQTCSPLQSWADTVEFGAYPDTIVNFPSAEVGMFYTTDLNFKVPDEVTPQLDPTGLFVGSEIVSFVVTSVEGMPNGINFACNSTNCEYEGGDNGCANIFGTPTTPGVYDIVINIKATILISLVPGFPPTPVDQDTEFTGYRIVVDGELNTQVLALDQLNIYPNPFKNQLIIDNPDKQEYQLQIFSTTGQKVYETTINGDKATINTTTFSSGIYTAIFSNQNGNMQLKVIKP